MTALLLLVLLAKPPSTPAPTVQVTPRFAFAPAAVRVLARRHSSQDVLGGAWCLSLWSEESTFERTSCEEGEGPDSILEVYEGIPPGHYSVHFTVRYSNGQERLGVGTFCVNGGEISCSEDPHQP
jgi:hypothetical protein